MSDRWHGGKGSRYRPIDQDKWDRGWEAAFGGKHMKFSDYEQHEVLLGDMGPPVEAGLLWYAVSFGGEAGEVMEKVKKLYRDDGGIMTPERLEALEKEAGDALWGLTRLLNHAGSSLENAALANIKKLEARLAAGTIHGDGDDR